MRDRVLIIAGLFLFMLLCTFPIWKGIASHSSTKGPDIKKPAGGGNCVAPVAYMREAHMELLVNMRDAKVRKNERQYKAFDGKMYNVGLTATCLTQCHGSKDQFCDRCHEYVGVPTPSCWGCHNSPKPLTATGAVL